MANAVTICRIVLSAALLLPPALSPTFLAIYTLAGATDVLDGYVARKTCTESALGAKLDSIADLLLAVVCLTRILTVIPIPTWLWWWIAIIALVKVVNVISGFAMQKRLVMLHTIANKIAGLAAFLVPFAIPLYGIAIPAIPACIIATFAAVQEGHLIRTGSVNSTS